MDKSKLSGVTAETVKNYLKTHPQFLDTYVTSSVISNDVFLKWSVKRSTKERPKVESKKSSSMIFKEPGQTVRKALTKLLDNDVNADWSRIFVEIAQSCMAASEADGVNVYIHDLDLGEFSMFSDGKKQKQTFRFKPAEGTTVGAHVAQTGETICAENLPSDSRFPQGIGTNGIAVAHVLCIPLSNIDGTVVAIVELYRIKGNPVFRESDQANAAIVSSWGSATYGAAKVKIKFNDLKHISIQLYNMLNNHRQQNDFLLETTRSIFQDMVSMDVVIMKIMNFAQKLVNADRASLFLVDNRTDELYARIFDVGTEGSEAAKLDSFGHKEIRFPIGVGIAGQVASTGQVLNIADAYLDDRFNPEVDSKTGYKTKTILCMPIYIQKALIGVVQMVNKNVGEFNKFDEEAFTIFAVYCGLALHHAKLYDKIRRSEQKHRVALEVLAYHSVCNKEEFQKIKKHQMPDKVGELETFDVHALNLTEVQKPIYAVTMFKSLFAVRERYDINSLSLTETNKVIYAMRMHMTLFGRNSSEVDDLIRFVLTIRKNYRKVPYHNWTHGWSVAHAMYVILRTTDIFTPLERLAMFVASLCHDLDHRGKNNAFMKSFGSPLASIYSTSVMEHHHFNQSVAILQILQHEGHNIFKNLTSEEYKWVLSNMKHCILSTDLALFFPNKAKLKKLLDDNAFDWNNKEHRLLGQAICMTGSDLIASAKPWDVQTDTVKVIFEEFYEQGDAEKANGREPIAMMDRNKAHELPAMQVGFLGGICIPCYELMGQILPPSEILVSKCRFNLGKWKELADKNKE